MSHVKLMPSFCAIVFPVYMHTLVLFNRAQRELSEQLSKDGCLGLKMFRQEDESDGKCRGNSEKGKGD